MSQHILPLTDLVVANGGTESNVLYDYDAGVGFRDADSITIFAPDTLPEVATVHVDSNGPGSAANFNPLVRGGADLTIGAGKAVTIELISFRALKIVLGGAAGAQRTFKVNKGVWA